MTTLHVLGLIFITLKLMGYIHWHWTIVLLPFLPMALLYLVRLAELFYVYIVLSEEDRRKYLADKRIQEIFKAMGL